MSKRNMSSAEAKRMFGRIVSKKAANAERLREEAISRLECPVERAKTYLRQRGWHVFNENVILLKPTSRIMVGPNSLEAEEVVAMAERIRARA